MEYDIRVGKLMEYVKRLNNKEDGRKLYLEYKEEIHSVLPQDAFKIFYGLLNEGYKENSILLFLDKIINVFHDSLSNHRYQKPKNDNFLMDLIQENEALRLKIDGIKEIVKQPSSQIRRELLIPRIEELKDFFPHYTKKENILFPYLEQKMEMFSGLSIMWALHNEVKNQVDNALRLLKDTNSDDHDVNVGIAQLFFGILGVVKKEELILFPASCEVLTEKEWYDMHKQSFEYPFPFIHKEFLSEDEQLNTTDFIQEGRFKSETGELTLEQLVLVFNSLPVDMTFVDEYNKVRFFTRPKDRVFPRSPAIIGRDVNNCHPPESVHIVEEIVDTFRRGEKDSASFWLNIRDKKILIQYFSLRNSKGQYKGVLEVSQDITQIQKLQGERRLLEWD